MTSIQWAADQVFTTLEELYQSDGLGMQISPEEHYKIMTWLEEDWDYLEEYINVENWLELVTLYEWETF